MAALGHPVEPAPIPAPGQEDPRLLPSKRGSDKLVFQGFAYTLKRVDKDGGKVWVCDHRDSAKCTVCAHTAEKGGCIVFRRDPRAEHNHLPSSDGLRHEELRAQLRHDAVAQAAAPTAGVVAQALEGLPEEAVPLMSTARSLRRVVWTARCKDAKHRRLADGPGNRGISSHSLHCASHAPCNSVMAKCSCSMTAGWLQGLDALSSLHCLGTGLF